MKIAIDLDNTITACKHSKEFFRKFTNSFKPSTIYIITGRDEEDLEETKKELKDIGIHYDKLIITCNKQEVIKREKIQIFFEDTDEFFQGLNGDVLVFKTREEGNYDFDNFKWIYSKRTGKEI